MNVRLVSHDDKLSSLCQEISSASPGAQWRLVMGEPQATSSGQIDLYIWDFDPTVSIHSMAGENPLRHLFLVDRKDLSTFLECVGRPDVAVLLKPVTRATLAAFL